MNFRDDLWNNYELVNNHFIYRRENLKDLITIISEIQRCTRDYANNMKKIYEYGYAVTPEGTLGESAMSIKEHLINQFQLYGDLAIHLKQEIVEPAWKFLDEQNAVRKKLYSDMQRDERAYKDAVASLEKAKSRFMNAAKSAEKALLDSEIANETIITPQEKAKFHTKSLYSLKDAKESEKQYFSCLNLANSLRVAYIESSKNILADYEQLEKDYIDYTRDIIRNFYIYSNNSHKNLVCDIEKGYLKIDVINTEKDIQDFIGPNQTRTLPPTVIEYQPYSIGLQSKPIDAWNYSQDVVYNVIVTLQATFEKTAKYFDSVEEKKKIQINQISRQACDYGDQMTPQSKKILLDLLKEKQYRLTFLYFLNKQRSDGRFTLSVNCFQVIGEILNYILDEVFHEKDYESARYCIILSQTFHYIKNKQKVFLQTKIENHPLLKNTEFWENFIAFSIFQEIEKQTANEEKLAENEEEKINRISNIAFSQLLPITDNMLEFEVDKEKLKEMINAFSMQYYIPEEFTYQIINVINEREYKPKAQDIELSLGEVKQESKPEQEHKSEQSDNMMKSSLFGSFEIVEREENQGGGKYAIKEKIETDKQNDDDTLVSEIQSENNLRQYSKDNDNVDENK